MGKITFILGGARSGKSTHALKLANKYKKVAFIATCEGRDSEMRQRIALHRKNRPKNWKTFEEPQEVFRLLKEVCGKFELVLIDCLTLLVANLLLKKTKASAIEARVDEIIALLKKGKSDSIIVSNEVGLGIVPDNKLGRDFRDIAGRINQIVAQAADEVIFMASGLPLKVKPALPADRE